MAIHQIAYDITDDIAEGVEKGLYKLFGTVVRNAQTGVVVKHLPEVDFPKKNSNVIFKAVKQNPIASIGISSVVTISAITAYTIKKIKEKQDDADIPNYIYKFQRAFDKYIDAIVNGKLSTKILDNLIDAFNKISETKNNEYIYFNAYTDELKELDLAIYVYTKKLAEANHIKLKSFTQPFSNAIDNLRYYLAVQKKIFEIAD